MLFISAIVLLTTIFISWTVLAQEIKEYTLKWDANTETDFAGYKVHVGTASRGYTEVIIPTGEQALATVYNGTITVPNDAQTTFYFAVTAYDTSGLESDYSNEVYKEYDTRIPPVPPKNLKWFEKVIAWIKTHWARFWS